MCSTYTQGYWKEQRGGDIPVLQMPADRPRPAVQTLKGDWQTLAIPENLATGLKSISNHENATRVMTLWTAFATLLYR